MTDRIDDLVQKINDNDFRIMMKLENEVITYGNNKTEARLTTLCKQYGLTSEEFIEWCEEY